MKSGTGSHELTRLLAAYVTSIAFGLTFLVASLAGVHGLTALWRGVVAGALALLASHLLAPPVVDAVLTAVARDEARRQAGKPEEDA
jgi:uncharacterized membrane protein YagU involved in acid resistance